ncbi:DNA repair ATPase [Saccharomycopsis crataegensis]|uniref:Structural maintenance of chromosomes protein 5 n=1 Tax=Saccharomycopsis crataegensis TaxID=43959 RepID=A0AAV5QJ24_9ASCO|nr:DNA repair ATPase [Saccharomycopsis crataegensis]
MSSVVSPVYNHRNGSSIDELDSRTTKRMKTRHENDDEIDLDKYNDGNIVKIKLKNFVTYSKTEFILSPTLNMIIGPNGTGKSTFVCAICLGLGGKPELLGRQKYAVDFIKEGEDFCFIEITLKFDHRDKKTITIRREMTRSPKAKSKEKSEWFVDNAKKDERVIAKLLKHLNLQLNNLCCFLPQDKVSSFAALKPEALLMETERATDPHLLEQHEKLIELDASRYEIKKELERNEENLANIEASRERLKEEAEKFLKFKQKKDELDLHEKLLPYAIVRDRKKKAANLKERRDALQAKHKKFLKFANPLDERTSQLEKEINKKGRKIENLKSHVSDVKNDLKEKTKLKADIDRTIEKYESEKSKLQSRSERKREELMKVIEEISQIKTDLQNIPEVDEAELRSVHQKRLEAREKQGELTPEINELKDIIRDAKSKADRINNKIYNLQKQIKSNDKIGVLDRIKSKQFRDTKSAVLRARQNPQLAHKLFEPPILSTNITDDRYVKYFEALVDNNTKLAFTAKSQETNDQVSKSIFGDINVSMRVPGKTSGRNFTDEQIKKMGFDGYLIDFIKGPEEVIKTVYESMYNVPVRLNDILPQQLENAQKVGSNGKPMFGIICAGDTIYRITRSRYGSKQAVCSAEQIRIFKSPLFGSKDINDNAEKEIDNLKAQLLRINQEASPQNERLSELKSQSDQYRADYDHWNKEHGKINGLRSSIHNLKNKLERKETARDALIQEAEKDMSSTIVKVERKITSLLQKRIEAIEELAIPVVEINKFSYELTSLEFEKIELHNKMVSMVKMGAELDGFKARFKDEVEKATKQYDIARKSNEVKKLKAITAEYSEELRLQIGELAAVYQAEDHLTEPYIVARIEAIKDEIGSLEDASSSSIDKLQTIERKLEEIAKIVPDLKANLAMHEKQINEIKGPWEERLDNLVQNISKNFSKKFVAVASAGEVILNKAATGLKDWKLELLVKFRDEGELRVLDPFIQSGGERAVSTIFFMLSLQGLTSSPFRVVDEINQGMDPKNESIVHKYMVESACQSDEQGNYSQYFLITPKLLTNLFYHEKMAVHCIMANHKVSDDFWR